MVSEAYSEQSGTSKMELLVQIVNNWNSGRLKMFSPKCLILNVRLRSENASGTVNYFRQKLHLQSLIGLWIFFCLYWVWRFLNEISKVCYEETQKNGNKHVPFVPRNSCSNNFINFWFWMANYQLGGLWHDSNPYEHLYL